MLRADWGMCVSSLYHGEVVEVTSPSDDSCASIMDSVTSDGSKIIAILICIILLA